MLDRLEKLEAKLNQLEEKINLLETKDYFKSIVNETTRLLSREYGRLISLLRLEFEKYDPKKQLNLRKMLLNKLPEEETDVNLYFSVLTKFLKENKFEYNLSEYEILLHKLKVIHEGKVSKKRLNLEVLDLLC